MPHEPRVAKHCKHRRRRTNPSTTRTTCVGAKTDTRSVTASTRNADTTTHVALCTHARIHTALKNKTASSSSLTLGTHRIFGLLVGAAFDQPIHVGRLAIGGRINQLWVFINGGGGGRGGARCRVREIQHVFDSEDRADCVYISRGGMTQVLTGVN